MVKYGSDSVGKYINQASQEQIQAINNLGQAIGLGMNVLSNQLSDINDSLIFLNRNVDILVEQQKLSNYLLQNIAELLRVPDNEKERQRSIELGIDFFIKAQNNPDLYEDALEELMKAESLMKQDYFVLHRIGCIYLYVEKYLNPEKALEYFHKAAKYASAETNPNASRLANALTTNFNVANTEIDNDIEKVKLLAADSYEKEAFANYVLGQFEEAVICQSKALSYNSTPQNKFLLAKYYSRIGNSNEAVRNLNNAIDVNPALFNAVAGLLELDLANDPEVIKLLHEKNDFLNNKINSLAIECTSIQSLELNNLFHRLNKLTEKSYLVKITEFQECYELYNKLSQDLSQLKCNIDKLIIELNFQSFENFQNKRIALLIDNLKQAKELKLEEMKNEFENLLQKVSVEKEIKQLYVEIKETPFQDTHVKRINELSNLLFNDSAFILKDIMLDLTNYKKEIEECKLKIGSKFGGGIVFYLDKERKHGLICTENDLGKYDYGGLYRVIGSNGRGISDGTGLINSKNIVARTSKNLIFRLLRTPRTQFSFDFILQIFNPSKYFALNKKIIMMRSYTAAGACLDLELNGFKDWYLPTIEELKLIYNNLHKNNLGNYKKGIVSSYWSSTENDWSYAYYMDFNGGSINNLGGKNTSQYVIAVRAF